MDLYKLNARQRRTLRRQVEREIREVAEKACGMPKPFNRWVNEELTHVIDTSKGSVVQRPNGRSSRTKTIRKPYQLDMPMV